MLCEEKLHILLPICEEMKSKLLAYGNDGDTTVEVDECTNRENHYHLTISFASASQTLIVASPAIVTALLSFLENKEEKELELSTSGGVMTLISKDREFVNRAFLTSLSEKEGHTLFRMNLKIHEMLLALNEASQDL